MATRMKTTIELPDGLVQQAKQLAAEEGTTLRALVDRALRNLLDERAGRAPFQLRDASVDGEGMTRDWRDAAWDQIRDEIYGLSG